MLNDSVPVKREVAVLNHGEAGKGLEAVYGAYIGGARIVVIEEPYVLDRKLFP